MDIEKAAARGICSVQQPFFLWCIALEWERERGRAYVSQSGTHDGFAEGTAL